jgi:hypothetical protein
MRPESARKLYAALSARRVEGWFTFEAAMLFAWIDAIQRREDVAGDLFEIGVHHGRSAAMLAAMAREGGGSLGACDLFGRQEGNASRSGEGRRDVFERNLQAVVPGTALRVFECSSAELTAERIGTHHRFFHVDGGHNPDEALSDLRLAAATTSERGVIAVDDPFKPEWPGVTEAVLRFLLEDDRFRALAVGFNKLLVVRREAVDTYARPLDDRAERIAFFILYPWQMKKLPFAGAPLRIFYVPSYRSRHSLRTKAIRFLESSPLATSPLVKPVATKARTLLLGDR